MVQNTGLEELCIVAGTADEMIEMIIGVSGKDISVIWDTTKPNGDLRRLMDVSKQEKYGLLTQTQLKDSIKKVYEYYTNSIR